ncbi:NarK/NasA family nitrate transporter [Nocardiopsis sp. HNM0947]|uniref:NarK/NasA family nitrate transporter n=1 Tax=Nocardiopsis coralli TaxID=2772213 RepID=A0ABR9P6N6_9ACTN|nr:nitrate/nitrite transporter [Nocardiopsis coralli]MBE2999479.1 NarK/NasA family nitrate transporter [Nocardiopsis coralli]
MPLTDHLRPDRTRPSWINHWHPEDPHFWEQTGRPLARRNLWASIASEHLGFSIWSIWSVLVLFMIPEHGFSTTPEQKFLLLSTVTLVGAVLRVPYTLAVPLFGGRNWTIISTALLIAPTLAALVAVQNPQTPFWLMMALAATAGLGGGNFSSSMANINSYFPEKEKGWALGLNAGGGNIGVATVQLVGLAVIALFTTAAPHLVPLIYLPLIALATWWALRSMNNLTHVRSDARAQLSAVTDRHFWTMSVLYIGTFGSFIGTGFAFGLLLQSQFGLAPITSAAVAVLGPVIGSLIRPLGGRLADTHGGARVTLWVFLAMTACALALVAAVQAAHLALFVGAFALMFTLTGLGNGSTYKMIPTIQHQRAEHAIAAGADPEATRAHTKRTASSMLGLIGAVGALGGVGVNIAFRESFAAFGTTAHAFAAFALFYLGCAALTRFLYLRPHTTAPAPAEAATR